MDSQAVLNSFAVATVTSAVHTGMQYTRLGKMS